MVKCQFKGDCTTLIGASARRLVGYEALPATATANAARMEKILMPWRMHFRRERKETTIQRGRMSQMKRPWEGCHKGMDRVWVSCVVTTVITDIK
jgi:hypothetical protein